MTDTERSARADWEARIGLRSDAEAGLDLPRLAAPVGLRASAGRGQVTIDWEPVARAAGYIIERAASSDGPWELLEVGEPEVRPVPHPPFTDSAGAPVARRTTGSRRRHRSRTSTSRAPTSSAARLPPAVRRG